MQTSLKGIELIKEFEGYREKAYRCSAGVWTIGYGSTKSLSNSKIEQKDITNKDEAFKMLKKDISQFEAALNNLLEVEINQNQYDALISFTYNVGTEALKKSTLLRKLNTGNFDGASREFIRWTKAKDAKTGKFITLPGLLRRRKAELKLFKSHA